MKTLGALVLLLVKVVATPAMLICYVSFWAMGDKVGMRMVLDTYRV